MGSIYGRRGWGGGVREGQALGLGKLCQSPKSLFKLLFGYSSES